MPNNIAEAKTGKQIFEDNFIMHTLNYKIKNNTQVKSFTIGLMLSLRCTDSFNTDYR